MNPGLVPGLVKNQWHDFIPKFKSHASVGGAAPTQPTLGNSLIKARWVYDPRGFVTYTGSLVFGSTATFGSGENFYSIELPLPIYRWPGSSVNPMGTVMLKKSTSSNPAPVFIASAVYGNQGVPGLTQGNEDRYFQINGIRSTGQGTGSIAGTNTSTTITHGLGQTPLAYDIRIVPTAITSGSATVGQPYIDTITSTQFNVNVLTAPGTGKTLSFSWRADCLPDTTGGGSALSYVNSLRPFTWAAGDEISWLLEYEPRT